MAPTVLGDERRKNQCHGAGGFSYQQERQHRGRNPLRAGGSGWLHDYAGDDQGGIYAARDRMGRTPLVIGKKEDAYCASFESFAYINLGYTDYKELGPRGDCLHHT